VGKCTPRYTCTPGWEPLFYARHCIASWCWLHRSLRAGFATNLWQATSSLEVASLLRDSSFRKVSCNSDRVPQRFDENGRMLMKVWTPANCRSALQVHVMKPPHPPNQACREVLSDYLALARTRLVDLKPDPSETVKVSSDQSQASTFSMNSLCSLIILHPKEEMLPQPDDMIITSETFA